MISFHTKKDTRFSKKLDSVFWWFLRILPALLVLFVNISIFWKHGDTGIVLLGFSSAIEEVFGVTYAETVYNSLNEVFSFTFEFFGEDAPIFAYGAYLVFIEIFHLFIDIILFIPRLAHKWMDGFTQND